MMVLRRSASADDAWLATVIPDAFPTSAQCERTAHMHELAVHSDSAACKARHGLYGERRGPGIRPSIQSTKRQRVAGRSVAVKLSGNE
jgi:hypothetical protein